MDIRFQNLGFVTDSASNAFKNLSNLTQVEGIAGSCCADITLRLDSPSSSISVSPISKGVKRKWVLIEGSRAQSMTSPLRLRLGNSSSSSDSKGSSATACTTNSSAKETDEESSMELDLDFSLHLGNEKTPSPKQSLGVSLKAVYMRHTVDLELSLSTGSAVSEVTTTHLSSSPPQNATRMSLFSGDFYMDEGSTSSHWSTGSQNIGPSYFLNQVVKEIIPAPQTPDPSKSVIAEPNSSVTSISGITKQRGNSTKTCQFMGCIKGARGASGLCIAHGGGRRCQKPGCHKGAEGKTAFCKAHGGGRRCEFLGCTKSAEGRTDYCIAHGGGRRCSHERCTRAARGKSGLCIRHGGGKRCQKEGCTRSAEGFFGLCISHGGGRRCQHRGCTKGAQGSTEFCKAHGGGKRCTYEGCTKGAEGSTPFCKGHGGGKRCSFLGGGVCPKSVHGGTLFCVAHGGGKRCAVLDCTKSARGRTNFCVRHGGGKRCKIEGCSKSAQGSTDFCKAHGGGKRCSWGQVGSEFGRGEDPCNAFTRGKTGLCTSHGALVQDKRVHGGASVGTMAQDSKACDLDEKNEVDPADNMTVDFMIMERYNLTSTGCTDASWKYFGFQKDPLANERGSMSVPVAVPEGRVHGGSLMAMLSGNSRLSLGTSKEINCGSSETGKS